jgi:hypothetical protein
MDAVLPGSAIECPSCAQPMCALALERHFGGSVAVDMCQSCALLWFDQLESARLAPAGVLTLFRAIHGAGTGERHGLPSRLPCPRCKERLQLTHDRQRATRFTYHRCPYGHGRLTPFFQFLREKDFVRPVSPAELERLKSAVQTVRCSGCGAAIDLATMTACRYCGASISILDPEAVSKTLRELASAKPARPPAVDVDVDRLVLAFASAQRRDVAAQQREGRDAGFTTVDLVAAGIDALAAHW